MRYRRLFWVLIGERRRVQVIVEFVEFCTIRQQIIGREGVIADICEMVVKVVKVVRVGGRGWRRLWRGRSGVPSSQGPQADFWQINIHSLLRIPAFYEISGLSCSPRQTLENFQGLQILWSARRERYTDFSPHISFVYVLICGKSPFRLLCMCGSSFPSNQAEPSTWLFVSNLSTRYLCAC